MLSHFNDTHFGSPHSILTNMYCSYILRTIRTITFFLFKGLPFIGIAFFVIDKPTLYSYYGVLFIDTIRTTIDVQIICCVKSIEVVTIKITWALKNHVIDNYVIIKYLVILNFSFLKILCIVTLDSHKHFFLLQASAAHWKKSNQPLNMIILLWFTQTNYKYPPKLIIKPPKLVWQMIIKFIGMEFIDTVLNSDGKNGCFIRILNMSP